MCAQVREIPEMIEIKVLYRGGSKTAIVNIPSGGNIEPISTAGHRAGWKNAQKEPKNNMVSEIINNKNPRRSPLHTANVW